MPVWRRTREPDRDGLKAASAWDKDSSAIHLSDCTTGCPKSSFYNGLSIYLYNCCIKARWSQVAIDTLYIKI